MGNLIKLILLPNLFSKGRLYLLLIWADSHWLKDCAFTLGFLKQSINNYQSDTHWLLEGYLCDGFFLWWETILDRQIHLFGRSRILKM